MNSTINLSDLLDTDTIKATYKPLHQEGSEKLFEVTVSSPIPSDPQILKINTYLLYNDVAYRFALTRLLLDQWFENLNNLPKETKDQLPQWAFQIKNVDLTLI